MRRNEVLSFCVCLFGLTASFSLYAHLMERITTDKTHVTSEFHIMLVCTGIYTIVSLVLRRCVEAPQPPPNGSEKEHDKYSKLFKIICLSFTTFGSSYTSIRALRHISYPTKVLGKTCKPIPILFLGKCLFNKSYPIRKYVSLVFLLSGATLFFMTGASNSSHHRTTTSSEGAVLLIISLICDGLTGVIEDHCVQHYRIGPFTLMYYMNQVSVFIALFGSVLTDDDGISSVFHSKNNKSLALLLSLGCAGGVGQGFLFLTLTRYGSLMTSVIGSGRKMLIIILSIVFFGHELQTGQVFGIILTAVGMVINLLRTPVHNKMKEKDSESTADTNSSSSEAGGDDDDDSELLLLPVVNSKEEQKEPANVFHDQRNMLFDVNQSDSEYAIAVDTVFRATTTAE